MALARKPQLVKASETRQPGFFGKLPIRGDFVARRIDGHVRTTLDQWLSAAITTSRRALGEGWVEAYRHAPIWRFVFTAGVIGPEPIAGILMPSADNYGREFPLIIAVEVGGCTTPLSLVRSAEPWFAAAERAALSCGGDGAELEAFDGRVIALGQPVFESDRAGTALRFAYGDEVEAARGYAGALEATLGARQDNITVWWTHGGGGVAPSLLHHHGLPAPERFTAFLDGQWEARGWSEELAPQAPETSAPSRGGGPLQSAARTHRGTRRSNNQDATLERPDLGLWAVADGAGGHDAGSYASAVVIAKLAEFQVPMSFASALTEIEELLEEANETLRAKGRQLGPERICAAVVVVILIHQNQFAVIWAGDSRAYLFREGRLRRLTRDHVSEGGQYVTRAVGAEDTMLVDVARGDIHDADRFVLCSDGIVKTIGDHMLEAAVRRGSASEVATELIDDALIAGARDNITALVVDVTG